MPAKAAQPDVLTVALNPPVEHATVSYAELKLREPTAGELAQTDGLEGYASDIKIISLIAVMPEGAVRLIPTRPFMKATRFIAGFMKADPETGEDD